MASRRTIFGQTREPLEFNIVLLGALNVGKSAIVVKYLTRRFITEYDPKLEGVFNKAQTIDGTESNVKVMDTYDQPNTERGDNQIVNPERYSAWAHGFVVVYSITNRSSFDRARVYLENLTQRQVGPIALVGNKADLERYRTVSRAAGEGMANDFDCQFHETSAADDYRGVERIFLELIQEVSRIKEQVLPLQPLFISEENKVNLMTSQSLSVRRQRQRQKSPKTGDKLERPKFDSRHKFDQRSKGEKLEARPKADQKKGVSSFRSVMTKKFNLFN